MKIDSANSCLMTVLRKFLTSHITHVIHSQNGAHDRDNFIASMYRKQEKGRKFRLMKDCVYLKLFY